MNIHLPAILGFTRYQGFDTLPNDYNILLTSARQCFCGRQLAQLVQAKTELHVCEGHPQQLTVAPSVAQAADVATDGDGRTRAGDVHLEGEKMGVFSVKS